jgi:predicted NBD/HSP70 family sugar kinase
VNGLKNQKEKRSMNHFAGLDVSVKETSVCIVDDTGKIVREVKVASEPEALLAVLKNPAYHFKRIGIPLPHPAGIHLLVHGFRCLG